MQEKIIQTKICKKCNSNFDITDKDLEFYDKIAPVFNDEKFNIPTPTLCPECRQQRRLSFRNQSKLYKRKCDLTGKDIISVYSPDKPYKVYNHIDWWTDKWNPLDYWIDFDFNRWFFEQFNDFYKKVPLLGLLVWNDNENSPFTNYTVRSSNIYMGADIFESENVYYSTSIKNVKNSCDCFDLKSSENCYSCSFSTNLYNCNNVIYSNSCSFSKYLHDCQNTQNSLFCVWIKDKKYYILNKQVSKEEFEEVNKKNDFSEYITKYKKLLSSVPRKFSLNVNSENCIWDNLVNSSNCYYCFDSFSTKNSKYVSVWYEMESCMDTSIHNINCEYDYEAIGWWQLKKSAFNIVWRWCSDIYYCSECIDSSNLFACIGLRNAKYCILNKQYTKEEYEKLMPKIINHMKNTWEWWEFFPSLLSPFWYNETMAQEYYPLTKEETEQKWFNWSDYEAPISKVEKIIPADKLPDNIADIPDDILNWAVECELTKKPFRIIKKELEFYRNHNLPIPRRHPDQRHLDRMALRNPRKLYEKDCQKCWKNIKTTYSNDRKEIVYCEECYNKKIY